MEEKNVPFLCGGVFLTLILQVKASWRTKKQIMMMGSKRHLVEESIRVQKISEKKGKSICFSTEKRKNQLKKRLIKTMM